MLRSTRRTPAAPVPPPPGAALPETPSPLIAPSGHARSDRSESQRAACAAADGPFAPGTGKALQIEPPENLEDVARLPRDCVPHTSDPAPRRAGPAGRTRPPAAR